MSFEKRLTEEKINEIKRMAEDGMHPVKIAKSTGFSLTTIHWVVGDTYRRKKRDNLAKSVAELRKKKLKIGKIAKKLGLSEVAVRRYLKLAYSRNYISLGEANSLSVRRYAMLGGENDAKE